MKEWMDKNPVTFMLYVVFMLVAVVGGVLVVFDQAGTLTFEDYLSKLTQFALAVGIFGAGRAVKNGILGYEDPGALPLVNEAEDDVPLEGAPDEAELRAAFPENAPVDSPDSPEGAVGQKHGESA